MKKLAIIFLAVVMIGIVSSTNVFATAALHDPVDTPESGWQRNTYNNTSITYYGGEWFLVPSNGDWASPYNTIGTGFKFNFIGTKFRLISSEWQTYSSDVTVKIDGQVVDTFSIFNSVDNGGYLLTYEKTGLTNGEHSIEFINNLATYLAIKAIDIDDTGTLKPFNNTIPTPTPTPTVTPTPTPSPAPSTGDRISLTVTLTNGTLQEYDLSITEFNAFTSWYDTKAIGSGPARYTLNDSSAKGPYVSKKTSLIFSNILTFSFKEYVPTP